MPQVRKDEVRERIRGAALEAFAEHGFRGATLADIAERAGIAVANVYRYFGSKEALFDAVVPAELAVEHARLVSRSARSLAHLASGPPRGTSAENEELLRFWLAHRHAVVILLDRAAETPHAAHGKGFVHRLVTATLAELRDAHPGVRISRDVRQVLGAIFESTRITLATLLHTAPDERAVREAIAAFRSYQMAGLAGLSARVAATGRRRR